MHGLHRAQAELLRMLGEVDDVARRRGIPYVLAYGTALGSYRDGRLIPWDSDIDLAVPHQHYEDFLAALRVDLPHDLTVYSLETHREYEQLFARVAPRNLDHNLLHVDLFPMAGASRFAWMRRVEVRLTRLLWTLFMIKRSSPRLRYSYHPKKAALAMVLKSLLRVLPQRVLVGMFLALAYRHPYGSSPFLYGPCGSYLDREVVSASWFPSSPSVKGFLGGREFPMPSDPAAYLTSIYGDFMRRPSARRQDQEVDFFNRVKLPGLQEYWRRGSRSR
jgi:lipopolysaccharide cholinephosphotransferase